MLLDKLIFQIGDGLIVISNYLKRKYEKTNTYIPLQLIPISAECTGPDDKPRTTSDRPIKFVYSGSFAEQDDLPTLIRAFQNVQRRRQNSTLLLSGKGFQLPAVQDAMDRDESIKYVGYLPDAEFYNFLRQADVLCMVRTNSAFANAGFPFKLGEYLATGNPVIASNVSDVGIYLADGEDVLLVEPGDVDALERAMEYCIDNYNVAVKIGRSGMEKCRQFFNPQTNGQLLLELMNIVRESRHGSTIAGSKEL